MSISALMEDVVPLLRLEFQRKRIALVVALDPAAPRVLGDAVQLQQVLLNVLVNAAEAVGAAEGGPREITVTTRQRPLDRAEPDGVRYRHGGRIWATRNQDRGLTMHIDLPLAQAPVSLERRVDGKTDR